MLREDPHSWRNPWPRLLLIFCVILLANSSFAAECGSYKSHLQAHGLPELAATTCETSDNQPYANRLLSQNFKVEAMSVIDFADSYEEKLKAAGWTILKAPFDRRNEGKFGVISATLPSGRVLDVVIRAIRSPRTTDHLSVRVTLTNPSMTPEEQYSNTQVKAP